MVDSQVWSVVLAAIVAGVITLITARWQRPKISAESESLAVATMERALAVANKRISALERRFDQIRVELAQVLEERDELRAGNDILRGQLREFGHQPRWPPS